MNITYESPGRLIPNPWNPNKMDPINEEKLANSLRDDGLDKAIAVRELEDGSLQILDGQHRVAAAQSLGWDTIEVVNFGKMTDAKAKKHTLIGNSRYGEDDPMLMANLLSDNDLGSADDILNTLPIDEASLASYFDHINIDLDDLDLESEEDPDAEADLGVDLDQKKPAKTHSIMRFKVSIDDGAGVSDLIKRTQKEQGYTESDELTNAGDALVYLLGAKE